METKQQHLEVENNNNNNNTHTQKKNTHKKWVVFGQTKSVIFSISFKTAVKNVLFRKTAASH